MDLPIRVRKPARLEGGRCCNGRVLDSEREATILLGEKIKANSWVVGVKVFADQIWQKVLLTVGNGDTYLTN
jgi:hypothetical protein